MRRTIGAIPLMLLILVLGHFVNILLNAMGAFIHSLRLQYVEFFTKFYEGGGAEFEPFALEHRYTIVPETEATGRDLAEMIKDIGIHPERYLSNENENIKRNGERVWIAWTNKAIRNKEGKVIEVLCIGNDITERRQAEEALRKSEEKFRILIEESP